MAEFESIQSTLASRLKSVKSHKDLEKVFISEKNQDKYYWAAIHQKLLYNKTISSGAKILWLILEDIGDANGYSYYGQKKLAERINKSIRMVQRYSRELVKSGWLIVGPGRKYDSNEYWVIWSDEHPNPKKNSMIKKSKAMEKRH